MSTIIDLYSSLEADARLQRAWRENQGSRDRCLEAPLIVKTPREVATAALVWLKLKFDPEFKDSQKLIPEEDLLDWAYRNRKDRCIGGPRLVNLCRNPAATEEERQSAIASLLFYRDRFTKNPLVRTDWSDVGLQSLAASAPQDVVAPLLKVTSKYAPMGVIGVAQLLCTPPDVISYPLPKIPGVGEERSDAIGVFGFRQGWPITDENLWQLCAVHGLLNPTQAAATSYKERRKQFQPHWEALTNARPQIDPSELAATLYLWANEAGRYRFRYWHTAP